MEVLRTLVIVVILFAFVINAEEADRKGKCGSNKSVGKQHQRHKGQGQLRKPYPLLHHEGHKFDRKKEQKEFSSNGNPNDASVNSKANGRLKKPTPQKFETEQGKDEPFNMFMHGDALVADPMEIPSTFGISPRLSISADGEVSVARSLSFNQRRHFQDDGIVEFNNGHEHMDEDHDHFHKIRTQRSAASGVGGKESGPQQLSSNLGNLEGIHTQQAIDVTNGAHAGNNLLLTAAGDSINVDNHGGSSTSGSGTVTASGHTTVTNSGKSP